jgi:hypothetical protein
MSRGAGHFPVLASTVNTQAAATGYGSNISSFTGAQALNDMIPLVYIAANRFLHEGVSLAVR